MARLARRLIDLIRQSWVYALPVLFAASVGQVIEVQNLKDEYGLGTVRLYILV